MWWWRLWTWWLFFNFYTETICIYSTIGHPVVIYIHSLHTEYIFNFLHVVNQETHCVDHTRDNN